MNKVSCSVEFSMNKVLKPHSLTSTDCFIEFSAIKITTSKERVKPHDKLEFNCAFQSEHTTVN